ncbi:1,3-beta-glucanosyltransferase gas1 [Tulasnella sp. JGI-2019a]|nr:1,3-beta-glucanosyltransferase gas1 [Tulasnella sp. JGI-2019a]KAG9012457.1 1,3-beta-glucanosyltransferase gas1 [Tulasnella sp. JGI-2019a]KAG9031502.1 1,3-beta-glucanosyltransferase gas1 [Tulasnella sp. JGI-2019a]
MRFFKTLAAASALVSTASALATVSRSGRYLYSNGARFSIKGVAYQPQGTVGSGDPTGFPEPTDYVDPLADSAGCARDLPYLKQLGVNAVRVYSVNSALNHDSCMAALSGAGIYVILDLALPVNGSINRAAPAWTVNLLDLYLGTINSFYKYDNLLAFNIGNEIVTDVADTVSGPYIKAAARDVKAYLQSISSTALVSFSSTDGDTTWRLALSDYLACDTAATSIDLFGLNNYRWCGAGTISNYAALITDYTDFPIPAYFSEFGCVTSPPRLWTEVASIFGDSTLTNEWSGGVAFSYFPAVGGYGMVNISSDAQTVTTGSDFALLQAQYGNVTVPTTPAQSAAGSNTQATCPAVSATWLASTTLPPTPEAGVCSCLQQNVVSCGFSNTASNNTSPILGDIIAYTCSALPALGGDCTPIGSNGTTGTYGPFSVCDPTTQVNFAISQYYQLSNRNAAACSFSGNATVVSTGPATETAAASAASSCAAAAFTGTTVPAAPSSTAANTKGGSTATGSGSSSSSTGGSKSGAVGGFESLRTGAAFAGMALAAVAGGIAVLI